MSAASPHVQRARARRDPLRVAKYRSHLGEQLSARLASAAAHAGDEIADRVARDIARCCETRNVWIGRGLESERGTFDGSATLWRCGYLLCPHCHAAHSLRLRRRARSAIESLQLRVGERFRFITLTLPTAKGVGLLRSYDIFKTAWQLFRKREFWRSRVGGGIMRIEWTPNADGFHVHAHIVVASKWMEFEEFRAEWTACIASAWKTLNVAQEIETRSGFAFVNIKLTYDNPNRSRGDNMASAINEAVKYVTKPSNYFDLPDSDLLDITNASLERARLPRSFEVIGRARQSAVEKGDNSPSRTLLDTANLSDGLISYPDSSEWTEWRDEGMPLYVLIRLASQFKRREALFHLPRWLWQLVTDRKIELERERRREALAFRYPHAEFATLGGDLWRGVSSPFSQECVSWHVA
jgi:hypothetical protein